jgi:hypothetical protein
MMMLTERMQTLMAFHASTKRLRRKRSLAYVRERGGVADGSGLSAAAYGLTKGRAVEILAQVHECQECIQDARLHFIGEVKAARGGSSKHFPVFGDVADDFDLTSVRGLSVHRLPAHLRALTFDLQREMQDAQVDRL